jgi:hypothetical protein
MYFSVDFCIFIVGKTQLLLFLLLVQFINCKNDGVGALILNPVGIKAW